MLQFHTDGPVFYEGEFIGIWSQTTDCIMFQPNDAGRPMLYEHTIRGLQRDVEHWLYDHRPTPPYRHWHRDAWLNLHCIDYGKGNTGPIITKYGDQIGAWLLERSRPECRPTFAFIPAGDKAKAIAYRAAHMSDLFETIMPHITLYIDHLPLN